MPIKHKLFVFLAIALFSLKFGSDKLFSSASDLTPANITSAINTERTNRDIPALTTNSMLTKAAQSKSNDMIARNYFSHIDPDGHYIWDKIVAFGYTPYTTLGENLAIDFPNTTGLVAAWMDSPEHRENLLSANFKDTGIGVSFGNVQSGQYSVAISNTFGAQPVISIPAVMNVLPTTQVTHTSKPTTAKPSSPKAQPVTIPKIPITTTIPITNNSTNTGTTSSETSFSGINLAGTELSAFAGNSGTDLYIQTSASNAKVLSASTNGNTVLLTLDPTNGQYTGTLHFEKNTNPQSQTLTLIADNNPPVELSLQNLVITPPLESTANSNATASQGFNSYTWFRYIIIILSLLFAGLVAYDLYRSSKHKKLNLENIAQSSNILLLLILVSSILLVQYWH